MISPDKRPREIFAFRAFDRKCSQETKFEEDFMSNNETIQHCSRCGAEIHGEDYTVFDNETFCTRCLERETVLMRALR